MGDLSQLDRIKAALDEALWGESLTYASGCMQAAETYSLSLLVPALDLFEPNDVLDWQR